MFFGLFEISPWKEVDCDEMASFTSSFAILIFILFFFSFFLTHFRHGTGVPGIVFAENHLQLGRLLHPPQRRMRLEWRIAQAQGIYGN
jgi:hypothetical protein